MLRALPAAGLIALVLALAGCGGGPGASSGTGARDAPRNGDGAPAKATPGGKLTVLSAYDVDFVDPGRTYYAYGFMVSSAVSRTLYAYAPGQGDTPVPDLAEEPPEISDDRKTVTVKLRRGVRFSPPVNREVEAKDVKYAFERAFSENVPNGYAPFYFGDVMGAPERPGALRNVPGIEVPDEHTVVLHLTKPSGVTVAEALTLPITSPVPQEYARRFDAKTPSTYDEHVAFTGPYMIRNSAEGRLIGRRKGTSIDLVRNPRWDAETDFRPAYVDEVRIDAGNVDATAAGRRVLDGSGLIQGDLRLPAPVVDRAVRDSPGQVALVPNGGFRFVALNTRVRPFDDLNVRKAVVAAFDRTAMVATRGGENFGTAATHFLPPGFPGHHEAGGAAGPGTDFLARPRGDLALAKAYMRKAGYRSGLYDGSAKLIMAGVNVAPGRRSAEVARAQLRKLGFKPDLRLVSQDTLYRQFCNVPRARVAICPNAGSFQDFQDPEALLEPPFDGRELGAATSTNASQLDDPQINAAMARAALLPPGPARNRAWGRIDRMIVAQAPGVPWSWDKVPLVASRDVRAVPSAHTRNWDLSFSSRGAR
jgi:peptide/nickel transport system substrate-binding protein